MFKINIIYRYALPVLMLLLIASCASNKSTKPRELIVFPSPPDTARVQYLTSISQTSDIADEQSGLSKFFNGENPNSGIAKPFGICAIKNKIYVVDSKLHGIHTIDLQRKVMEFKSPQGGGFLKFPLNVFADTIGNVYVADQNRKEIVVFDYNLEYKTCFGNKILEKPTDVAAYKDKIYVADAANHKIQVFSAKDYKLISSFPDVPEKDTAFLHQPIHLAVKNNKVYVTDFGEFNIKKFDIDGKFLNTIGSYGESPGQFSRPKGLAVDKNDYLYVLDAAFQNIQIFNNANQQLMYFGGDKSGPGYLVMPIRITIDYDNLEFFQKYVDPKFRLKHLIYVTNQFGGDKITVYGFVDLK